MLNDIDIVGIAKGYGVERRDVRGEAELPAALKAGLAVVQNAGRPYVLNVYLPSILPEGGRQATPFQLG